MKEVSYLKSVKEIEVRFSELDPLNVVWHGNYIKYFEDGREDFGQKHGLGYCDIRNEGFMAPIISIKCKFKKFVRYGEKLAIETSFVNNPAAKIVLNYSIRRSTDNEEVAEGSTEQVFTDPEGNLFLIAPDFFIKWKQKWGLQAP
jgi:acyl-CoA thioester hydrolase